MHFRPVTAPPVRRERSPRSVPAEQDSNCPNTSQSNAKISSGHFPEKLFHTHCTCTSNGTNNCGLVIMTRDQGHQYGTWQSQASFIKTQDFKASPQTPSMPLSLVMLLAHLKVTGEIRPMSAYAVTLWRWNRTPSISSSSTTSWV